MLASANITARTVHECHSNSIRDLSQISRVAMGGGAAEGFHSFQLSKRNLFIENF